MKRRVQKILNFSAFNLLFFALYLNFIHKDQSASVVPAGETQHKSAAVSGTVVVEHPEAYLQQKTVSQPLAAGLAHQ
ncbi:hypothetical protein JMG10_06705 [Nostoc ellipsosporum NOK]|nr:hypothetical protein [Nostoc ellipsosporum NOK]